MRQTRTRKNRIRRYRPTGERLEPRRVLDASALPLWDQPLEVEQQILTLDEGGVATANAQSGNWTYTTANNAVTITGYTGAGGAVEIPSQIGGLPVKVIGANAFYGKASLTSITIPESVISIGSSAFSGCSSLTGVTIPASVTTIGGSAFYSCSRLTSVTIPESVISIGSSAFSGCSSLTGVTIPASVTTIGGSAFYSCSRLTSVTIPESVTSIGTSAFSTCSSLLSINVDSENATYASVDGVLFDKALSTVIQCPGGKVATIVIPASVTSIGAAAFLSCSSLTGVTIPESVTAIQDSAFKNCTSFNSVTISASVLSIGSYAFSSCSNLVSITISASVRSIASSALEYCSSLLSITVDTANPYYASVDGVLFDKGLTTLIQCPGGKAGTVEIPASVTGVGANAFQYCSIAGVKIPESVTTIRDSAFRYCRSLTSVTIPSSVFSVGSYAFSSCSNLVSITISASVISIGDFAFSGCSSLTGVTIPASVTSIGSSAFSGCSSLTNVMIPESVILIGESAFYSCSNLTGITIPISVTSIGAYAFQFCRGLANVTIPDSVTSIGGSAFSSCSSLLSITVHPANPSYASVDGVLLDKGLTTLIQCPGGIVGTVVIPESVTSIGRSAFQSCSKLTNVMIPRSVTNIGDYAFSSCGSLTGVTIPQSVTGIGSSAFSYCRSLLHIDVDPANTSYASVEGVLFNKALTTLIQCPGGKGGTVEIPASVSSIGSSPFQSCSSLLSIAVDPANPFYASVDGILFNKALTTLIQCPGGIAGTVVIPESVTYIGTSSFSGCARLMSVTIPASVTSIGTYAFSSCSGLATVAIPASVSSIGSFAFQYCSSLTSITIPGSVTSIGDSAFSSCSNLSGVAIQDGVAIIGNNAFSLCRSLLSVTIPPSVTTIGGSAFYSCSRLTSVTIPESVTIIGGLAFSQCDSLASITIPASVTSIGGYAFNACDLLLSFSVDAANPSYASVGGILFNKSLTTLIQCPGGKIGTVDVPASVTKVGSHAFYSCSSLTNVTIPASVKSIGDNAFCYCSNLTRITLPASVTGIGLYAFSKCDSLRSIAVDSANTSYASVDGILFDKAMTTLIQCPGGTVGTVVVRQFVTSILSFAIEACGSLLSISVDAANPFYASVDGLLFDKALTTLIQCPGGIAGTVVVPESVTYIGTSSFSGCASLTGVTIPASVQSIGRSAFSSCITLKSLNFRSSPPAFVSPLFTPPVPTVYRLPGSTGWESTYADAPVKIYQPVDIAQGQEVTVSIDYTVDRIVKTGTGTAILTAASTRTGGTVVEAGELVVRERDALGMGLLEVQAGAKVTLQTGYDIVSVTSLDLASTSRLEISIGRISVAANGCNESDIRSLLIAGRNNGTWDGTSGITSTFAGGERSIGYRVADGALEIAYAAPGDANLDGIFDMLDLSEILGGGKFNTAESANWQQGDTNYDGVFDMLDLSDILGTGLFNEGSYLQQSSASSAVVEASSTSGFDQAMVFAALESDTTTEITKKRVAV